MKILKKKKYGIKTQNSDSNNGSESESKHNLINKVKKKNEKFILTT